MKFDTIIIGGGLAGLVCGIKLSQQGQRCVIISSGQSALHFLSGSFDLLNSLPDGTAVENPLTAIKELIPLEPDHPYAKLGEERFKERVKEAERFFSEIGIPLKGNSDKNHYRITPIGTLKRTWLTLSEFITCGNEHTLPWKEIAIFNPVGFLDFYPSFVADELRKTGIQSGIHEFSLPELDNLRRNPSELRSTHIARILDKENNLHSLGEILKEKSGKAEIIILPACLGLSSPEVIKTLEKIVGKPVYLIPTIPPSIAGIRVQQYLKDYFQQLGGIFMMGDSVLKADIKDNLVKKVYSYNHGDIPFESNHVVLATGSYFSRGLIATREEILEPIFNLQVSYLKERKDWYTENIFEPQGYQQFGVATTSEFQGISNGKTIRNLFVAGAILEGFNPIKEGSGGGVSILSALDIADKILKNEWVCNCNNTL